MLRLLTRSSSDRRGVRRATRTFGRFDLGLTVDDIMADLEVGVGPLGDADSDSRQGRPEGSV